MRQLFDGVNGRKIGVDLSKVESVEDAGDGEVHMHTSSDWYRVRADFPTVAKDWQEAK